MLLSLYVSSEVSLSWEKMLRPIQDTGWGWYAEWEVLLSLDRCERALCCYLEFCLLLQVDHGWSEKGSECIFKGKTYFRDTYPVFSSKCHLRLVKGNQALTPSSILKTLKSTRLILGQTPPKQSVHRTGASPGVFVTPFKPTYSMLGFPVKTTPGC